MRIISSLARTPQLRAKQFQSYGPKRLLFADTKPASSPTSQDDFYRKSIDYYHVAKKQARWRKNIAVISAFLAVGVWWKENQKVKKAVSTKLSLATIDGDINAVKELLVKKYHKEHVDVNEIDGERNIPLHYAARYGLVEIASFLLNFGANANATNRYGVTPVYESCMNGNVNLVNLILHHVDQQSIPILEYFDDQASGGNLSFNDIKTFVYRPEESIREIIQFCFSAEARENFYTYSPIFMKKIFEAKPKVIDAVNKRSSRGWTPVMVACSRNNIEVVRSLLNYSAEIDIGAYPESYKLKEEDGLLYAPLYWAVWHENIEMARVLIEAKPSILFRLYQDGEFFQQSILHVAINNLRGKKKGSIDLKNTEKFIIEFIDLLRKSLNDMYFERLINSYCKRFYSPLHLAAYFDNIAITRKLVECKANPYSDKGNLMNEGADNGAQPITEKFFPLQFSGKETRCYLMQKTAEKAKIKYTYWERGEAANQLIEMILDDQIPTASRDEKKCSFHKTCLAITFGLGNYVIKCLEQYAKEGKLQEFLNYSDKYGRNFIYYCAFSDGVYTFEASNTKVFQKLAELAQRNEINLVPYITKQANDGWTPFLAAAWKEDYAMVELLLDKLKLVAADKNDSLSLDAQINAQTSYKETPLYWAVGHRNVALAKLLLQHNANPNLRANEYAPLHLAALLDDPQMICLLVGDNNLYSNKIDCGNKADLNLKTAGEQHTALALASWKGNLRAVNCLISCKANPYLTSLYGRNAFFMTQGAHDRKAVAIRNVLSNYMEQSYYQPVKQLTKQMV